MSSCGKLLYSSTPLSHPTSSLPKISPCSLGGGWPLKALSYKEQRVGLIVRVISFQDFQPTWSWCTNITDGQTDGTCSPGWSRTYSRRAVKRLCVCVCVSYMWNTKTWLPQIVTTYISRCDVSFRNGYLKLMMTTHHHTVCEMDT